MIPHTCHRRDAKTRCMQCHWSGDISGSMVAHEKPKANQLCLQQHFAIPHSLQQCSEEVLQLHLSLLTALYHLCTTSVKTALLTMCQKTWKYDYKSHRSPSSTPSHWEYIDIAKHPGRSSAWQLSLKILKDTFKAAIFLCSLPFSHSLPSPVYIHTHTTLSLM